MSLDMIKKILRFEGNISCDEIINSIIIYLRKSRKDTDYFKEESIEKTLKRHETQLQEWAVSIFGVKIPEKNIFREVASGDTIDDRPIMQKVLNMIEYDKIRAVLCIEIERLARGNTIDQGIIAQAFKYSNTKIITPYKIYDLDNEDDLVYFEDGLYQSRKYLLYTKRILKRGRIRSVQDGKYIASIEPYGYKKRKLINEKGFTLEFNLEESRIINLIANLYAYGIDTTYTVKNGDTISSISKIYSMKQKELISINANSSFRENEVIYIKKNMGTTAISNYLNYLNIKPRKAAKWTSSAVRNILTSPTLYGYVTWGAREVVTIMSKGEFIKTRPRNKNCMYVKGEFRPILELAENRTRIIIDKLKNNRTFNSERYEIKNPLAGLIICSVCKKNMVRRPYNNKSKADTLYCKTTRCETVGSNLNLILDRLLCALTICFQEYNNFIDNYNQVLPKDIDSSNDLVSIIETELSRVNSRLMRCYDFVEDGTYTKDIFYKRISKLRGDIANLEKRKKEILSIDTENKHNTKEHSIPQLCFINEIYKSCDTSAYKNELLSSIIKKIVYIKNKGGRGYEDKFKLKIFLKI